ncbi:Alpha/Beta hydrolase protein [Hygrophoropsis aurantiaca]|uniref:Alpha/Beta hydrolase protein n=1 Tax=Hygrophoropsis aurantiaca TaxID=72124 RepID=A0ACB8AKF0_9AGAM|nr:Alpha/Beta hydrolase protein [Hygrophoropsis aurantiaca]
MSSAAEPFTLAIPDEQIAALRAKLELATFPDELQDAGWDYGAPLADIKRLVARWKDGYDWRAEEKRINDELPMFTTDIDVQGFGNLNIHFVHQKSTVVDAVPLLFVHGWPGSFLEVRKILPLLTATSPEHPSFHVVALSLPGYGFSEAPHQKGFGIEQYAEVGNKLMLALGYNEYVTQGGDWGYVITRVIGNLYGGKHSKAWHTNFPIAAPPAFTKAPFSFMSFLVTPFTAEEKAGLARTAWFRSKGRGYFAEQSTQPQTLGYGLADSPVGLLAWIYEKLVVWTDSYPWTDDEVLTWISIYLFSRAGPAASLRIYYELGGNSSSSISSVGPTIPMGVSSFPKELLVVPIAWVRSAFNVVFESKHKSGGHFAAHEKPDELVGDLRKMFGKGGKAFGVVPGKTGFA